MPCIARATDAGDGAGREGRALGAHLRPVGEVVERVGGAGDGGGGVRRAVVAHRTHALP